jgi:subtilisin family serine protease
LRRARGLPLLFAVVLGTLPAGVGADDAAPREWIVELRGPADAATLARLAADTGGRVLETIPGRRLVRLALPQGAAPSGSRRDASLARDALRVAPNSMGRGGFTPDDPQFEDQWHLNNTGQTSGTPDADLDAPEGWERTRGSANVWVAILDTGVDYDHPDLAGRLLPGRDTVNDDDDPNADHPHGIQVAGLFGANADNAIQVAGVDHAARILPVKVLGSNNAGSTFDLIQGIDWAVAQGADVISMSLVDYEDPEGFLREALQRARTAEVILVACAGNGGPGDADCANPDSDGCSLPGSYPETISVGFTDHLDLRGAGPICESATGPALDVVAPAVLVPTVTSSAGQLFSCCSAATPIVAGIVSLLLSLDPTLTHDEVKAILEASAEDQVGPSFEDVPGRDDFYGAGRVNLAAALQMVPEADALASALTAAAVLGALRGRWAARTSRHSLRSGGTRPFRRQQTELEGIREGERLPELEADAAVEGVQQESQEVPVRAQGDRPGRIPTSESANHGQRT